MAEYILSGGMITDREIAKVMIDLLGARVSLEVIDWEGSGIAKPSTRAIFGHSYAY